MPEANNDEFCRASDIYRKQVSREKASINPIYEEYLAEFKDKLVDVEDTTVLKELYVSRRLASRPYLSQTDKVAIYKEPDYPVPPDDVINKLRALGEGSPERKVATLITGSEHRTCIILKGNIGVGKSTTTRYILYEFLHDYLGIPLTIIYIDLLRVFGKDDLGRVRPEELTRKTSEEIDGIVWKIFAKLGNTFYEYLLDEDDIPQEVQNYFGRYLEQMEKCRNDPVKFGQVVESHQELMLEHEDRLMYNMVRLLYLKASAKRNTELRNFQKIVLVLDNLDNGNEDTHRCGIEIGKKFANISDGTCIIPIRYKTLEMLKYELGKEVDEMPMYIVDLAPPDVGDVIERRLQYFLKDIPKRSKLTIYNKRIDPDEAISDVVVKLLSLLLTDKGRKLLQSIHNNNVRNTIESCADMLASHEDILPLTRLIQQLTGVLPQDVPPIRERLAFDNLILLVGLSNRRFYDSKYSSLENVFCSFRKEFGEANNLVKLRILNFLSSMQANGEREMDLVRLYEHMDEVFGYQEMLVHDSINQLLKPPKKLLWSRQGISLEDPGMDKIQISEAGRYYIEHLYTYVWYVCLMKEDTWVPCNIAKEVGFVRFKNKRMLRFQLEMQGTLAFVKYLVDSEVKEVADVAGKAGSAYKTYKAVYGKKTITGPMLEAFSVYLERKRDHILASLGGNLERYNILREKIAKLSERVNKDIMDRIK